MNTEPGAVATGRTFKDRKAEIRRTAIGTHGKLEQISVALVEC